MRKRYRVLLLAAVVAAFVVPVGFALSLESNQTPTSSHVRVPVAIPQTMAYTPVAAAAPMHATNSSISSALHPVPEGVRLFFLGSALFAIAAAMRRSG